MSGNQELLEELNRAVKNKPDIELGKFIRYISSVSDLAYMTDEDLARQARRYNKLAEESKSCDYIFKPSDIKYIDHQFDFGPDRNCPEVRLHEFTKENEQTAYDRYKERTAGRIFFSFEERLDCCDFLKRFPLIFVKAEDFKGITVINHCDNFLKSLPGVYKHMNAYMVGRKGDKYVAMHRYAEKFPCFGELLRCVTLDFLEDFDECFSIAIDWYESPRFTDYVNHILYGVRVTSARDEIEIYNQNQTIEMFHELMQKSNKIVSTWRGVIYDDGTVEGDESDR